MKERLTISVESSALAAVRDEVESGEAPNLSAAIEAALQDHARARALDHLLDSFAANHPGEPLTDSERAWARDALGGGPAKS